MDFKISAEHDGKSVLTYLKSVARISSGSISQLKKIPMGITVNNSHVTVRYVLKLDDLLSVKIEDGEDNVSENIVPVDLPVGIVYEDEHIMAVNKPPFMPTHPSHKHFYDTLGNAVAHIYKERGLPFVFRPLGRLDANTSGLVVLSKSRAVASFYFEEAQQKRIIKHYIAILDGEMDIPTYAECGKVYTIEKPIKRCADSIITREVSNDADALPAKTVFRILYTGNGISIVDASPITGRTHQLRVHFSSIGLPLVNDVFYGNNTDGDDRHLLHAVSLNLKSPFSDENMLLFADPPDDIADFVKNKTGKTLKDIIEKYDFSIDLSKI